MTETETDEYVSKRLGVPALHTRVAEIEEGLADMRVRMDAVTARLDGHVRRMDYLDDKDVDLSTRISALEERVLHAWPPASDIEERLDRLEGDGAISRARLDNVQDGLAGERRWRNARADQVRLWLYALAGSQAALAVGLLAEVRWG